jgi:putative NADPH-quinone reductase
MAATRHIAIIVGHPDPRGRHYNHALADAYTAGARAAGHVVETIDIAHSDFPLLRCRDELDHGTIPDAIQQAQTILTRADHIVLMFPLWNGGMPALLKGFLEQTFRSTFIFPDAKPGDRLGFRSYFNQRKALAGKSGRIVTTMQMPAFVYRWYFHPHPEKNTLKLGGISPLRETLIGLVEAPDPRKRERWLVKLQELGQRAM